MLCILRDALRVVSQKKDAGEKVAQPVQATQAEKMAPVTTSQPLVSSPPAFPRPADPPMSIPGKPSAAVRMSF